MCLSIDEMQVALKVLYPAAQPSVGKTGRLVLVSYLKLFEEGLWFQCEAKSCLRGSDRCVATRYKI